MDKNSSQKHRILRLTSGSGAMIADKGEKFMRLLIEEDERSLSRAVKTILEHEHYSVDAVDDGAYQWPHLSVEDGGGKKRDADDRFSAFRCDGGSGA